MAIEISKSLSKLFLLLCKDYLAYEVHEDSAVIRRISRIDVEWANSIANTLTEWVDELDDEL